MRVEVSSCGGIWGSEVESDLQSPTGTRYIVDESPPLTLWGLSQVDCNKLDAFSASAQTADFPTRSECGLFGRRLGRSTPLLQMYEGRFQSSKGEHTWEFLDKLTSTVQSLGLPGGASGKEPACQYRRCKSHRFDPWVRKNPWRNTWQSIPAFSPGESHGQSSLVGYGP